MNYKKGTLYYHKNFSHVGILLGSKAIHPSDSMIPKFFHFYHIYILRGGWGGCEQIVEKITQSEFSGEWRKV